MVELTERFGVSQSVIREALTRLTEQGLLVATPQRGFRVRDLSIEDIAQLTETRIQIEALALRLAVERGDLQWETGILAAHHRLERTPVTRDDGTVSEDWSGHHRDFHQALLALDVNSPKMKSLIDLLVSKHVALTSTLPVFEPVTGREVIQGGGGNAILPQVKEWVTRNWKLRENKDSVALGLFRRELAWEKQFYDAGGLLVAGTDPTGSGRTIAGYANYREIELLVEGGFTIAQAIKICTLNGALYLRREKEIGTLAPGKHADLVLINGDLNQDIRNIRKTEIVFKNGIGFDSQKIFASVKERVGIN